MVKKRLIFSLLYYQDFFVLSRNFKKQKVGDFDWLLSRYKLLDALNSLDELVIINLDRNQPGFDRVLTIANHLSQVASLPLAIGGGITNLNMAKLAFQNGADKLVINSLFFESFEEFCRISSIYGAQSIVLSIDYKVLNGKRIVFSNGGTKAEGSLEKILAHLPKEIFGELLLRNMDRDGTGFGNDLHALEELGDFNKPLLIAGGTGKSNHTIDALDNPCVDGIVTANILNFVGTGLVHLRSEVAERHELAKW